MVARSGDGWVIAPCLAVLFDQLDAFAPDRPTLSDGSIGDARHQAESFSDHNPRQAPDGKWYVTAGDVTSTDWVDSWVKDVLTKDTRVKYLIWRGQYWQRINWDGGSTFEWRAYHGTDPHTSHVHISVQLGAANDKRPWGMPEEDVEMPLSDDDVKKIVAAMHKDFAAMLIDPYHNYLPPIHKRLAALEDRVEALGDGSVKA